MGIINPSESQIQIAIVDYLKLLAPRHGFIFFSIPNSAYGIGKGKSRLSGSEYGKIARLVREGLTAGAADLQIVHNEKAYFLEVKKPGGRMSDKQKDFMESALAVGAEYAVVQSVEEVIILLKSWRIT